MPSRKASSLLAVTSVKTHATQKERMESLETRMEGLIQWHQDLGDRVESLEQGFQEVREEITKLSTQLTLAATNSQVLLNNINTCLVGSTAKGLERPGLVDDVKAIAQEQQRQGTLIQGNVERLSSLERTRATIVWAGGGISTLLTAVGFWVWSHTDQILATVSNVYGKPKTETSSNTDVSSK